ncbi:hypothetical protein [Paenibacillus ottowii]
MRETRETKNHPLCGWRERGFDQQDHADKIEMFRLNGRNGLIKFYDLYEPLILLIERGGTIRRQHGDIIAGGYAFPLANADYMAKQAPIEP